MAVNEQDPFQWLWDKMKSFFWTTLIVPLMPLLPLVPFAVALFGLLGALGTQIDTLISGIDALTRQIKFTPATVWIGSINRIIPLSEGMAMASALMVFRVAALVIRVVLSFIPGR